MKALVLLFFFSAGALFAQKAEPKPSVGLEVKVVKSGAATKLSQSGDRGKVGTLRTVSTAIMSREKEGRLELEIALQNYAQRPEAVTVEWFFFARDVKGTEPKLHCEGAKTVEFKPGGSEKVYAVSAPALSVESRRTVVDQVATSEKVETAVATEQEKVGLKIIGWLVRTKDDGVTLGYKASSPRFEKFLDDDARGKIGTSAEDGGGFVK